MKKHLVNKFDKKTLPSLPRVLYEGRIVVVITEDVAEKAVDFLLSHNILGIDTETRPCFTKGRQNKVALLQVSTHNDCFLFRLNQLSDSPAVKRLLEDRKVLKVGLSLHDDINSLSKRFTFKPGFFLDLQNIMKELGIEDLSLAKLYANLFGMKISKREQLSNWEADVLSEKQKRYAATDAWACINLYEEYLRLKETHDYELEIVSPPAQTTDNPGIADGQTAENMPKTREE
ncbi:MAG: 3'-5' exonuclease domain-containing protein 2 [Bacteroidales bacterium]|nr:3'-5' exonuclease domain-containing protein 2 [Bacteroidales bacterium]